MSYSASRHWLEQFGHCIEFGVNGAACPQSRQRITNDIPESKSLFVEISES
jgi:hypothetical protein